MADCSGGCWHFQGCVHNVNGDLTKILRALFRKKKKRMVILRVIYAAFDDSFDTTKRLRIRAFTLFLGFGIKWR